ncbi:MAG: phenylalanine--tRNA ligase subunit beta [Betaproteobacteria bacterium]|nr:phenylalanine--tRNA ligase subunit beta [Betaproteobacteria bacterium]
MQFSKKWLNELIDGDLGNIDLSNLLTQRGLEVEEVEDLSQISDLVVVAEIIEIQKHPNADRLNVCKVDVGEKEHLQIVCGAPNAKKGIKIPCAKVGAKLDKFEIKKTKLRGVDSSGMLCSGKELNISNESEGILELDLNSKVGDTLKNCLSLDDQIFHLSITPNRPDCLSMRGIAKEISAMTDLTYKKELNKDIFKNNNLNIKVKVKNEDSCPLYCLQEIQKINNKVEIPGWLKERLSKGGIDSINPAVDVLNYMMLKYGQPMHAFDIDKIKGSVQVRNAVKGEKLLLLNHQEITFHGDELVIADDKNVLALAGIMGGLETSVTAETKNILLESAFFSPISLAGVARKHSLNTDASHRFERGVDFKQTLNTLNKTSALLVDLIGGSASNIDSVQSKLPARNSIMLHTEKVVQVLGLIISKNDIKKTLNSLEFTIEESDEVFLVTPPSYRFDINIEEDLIEEVIRIYGFDKIKATPPTTNIEMLGLDSKRRSPFSIKSSMAALGYNEIVSYSFIQESVEKEFHENNNLIKLDNPIASQMSVMRSKLWGSHIDALNFNINRGQNQIRLFEVASIYEKLSDGYKERQILSGVLYGSAYPEQWGIKSKKIDFYEVKGDLETISDNEIIFKKNKAPGALHPGISSSILKNGKSIGWLGQLHPKWKQHYDIKENVFLFEIDLESIRKKIIDEFDLPSKLLPIRKDISVLVDNTIEVGDMVQAIKKAKIDYIKEVNAFDVYEGENIEKDKKSIAFLILMQDTYKTLEEEQVNNSVKHALKVLQQHFNASLR